MTTPTDPTPRTAATAREALATIRASLQREYDSVSGGDRPPYYANGILYALMVIDKYATPEVLAAAEAPGRVAAMEAAKQEGGATGDELSAHTYQPEVNR